MVPRRLALLLWLLAWMPACHGFRTRPAPAEAGVPDLAADHARADLPHAEGPCTTTPLTDPRHCGACGRDCQGGDCKDGLCQPLVLVENRAAPQDLVVGGAFVYWVEQGTFANLAHDGLVLRAPIAGCAPPATGCPARLAEDQISPGGVALDGEHLYWPEHSDGLSVTATGKIWQLDLRTSEKVLMAGGQDRPRKVAVDGTRLYWITADEVRGRYVEGGTPGGVSIASGQASPVDLTLTATRVLWTSYGTSDYSGSVRLADLDGSNQQTVAQSLQQPRGLATDPTYLYWTNAGNGTVMRSPLDRSSQPAAVVSSAATPNDVAVDLDWLYWLEGGNAPYYDDGRVMALRLDGSGGKRTLASGQRYPRALAVDAQCVYWVNRGTPDTDKLDGAVVKVARPR